ncbi:Hypothetical predicted protein [Marmota monax]|uniref:AP-1 complex subunit mu-2 n=1 Tax=Marmota monax TaxID=9995 RepID=A0A5E4ABN6_MARMO|nr:Hypothetical predicted protein [Marmota monax]
MPMPPWYTPSSTRLWRSSVNTSRSWRRRASVTTLSLSMSCWMSSWTLVSHRPRTARSYRSEWATWAAAAGPWVEGIQEGPEVFQGLAAGPRCPPARYITQQGNKLETGKSRVPPTVTNAVSWRSEGIKYKKNEVFIDVIESVNLLVNANGSVLLSEIVGTIKLKVFLSGMPELRLGLNDRVLFELTGRSKNKSVELEDVKFHQCVRLSRFDNDRTISFIPPDGDFELMSYRLSTQVKPLIWIESVIEKFSHSRVEIMVKAKGQFKKQSVANGVEISVPVPSDADSPRFKTSVGSAKYVPEKNVVIWSIKSFPGGKEYLMRAHFGLPSVEKEEVDGRPPIGVKFEIPYFTVSGIQVRYMKIIEKSGYQALPWVRYITQSGDYQLRTS